MSFGIPALENTYYGSYRTHTFAEIYPDYDSFLIDAIKGPFAALHKEEIDTKVLYILLYARYGNSHISYSDENQFRANLFSTIWQYGPTWQRRVEIQQALRDLNEDELLTGGKAIYNHSYNPSTAPSTSTLEELLTINDQNTTNYKRTKLEAYSNLMMLLETDVTEEFINKFRKLFIKVLAADTPLLYTTEVPN